MSSPKPIPLSVQVEGQRLRDLFEERAGIIEFTAGKDRREAENLARKEVYGELFR